MKTNKSLLIILDGWGIGNKTESDVIYKTPTPNLDNLYARYPSSYLLTSGENVGLPDGQMGNSEVGHLNIGAGRIVYQDLVKINKACEDNSISSNKILIEAYRHAKENNSQLHFIGLVSDGGVHSSDKHLYKLCDIADEFGLKKVYIHALTDGRDVDPYSGLGFIENLEKHIKNKSALIASVCGRYYTMDRDKRWERVKEGYDLLVHGKGIKHRNAAEAIKESYAKNKTDEFIEPAVIVDNNNNPVTTIKENDVVICFNFRTDRLREITTVLTQQDMPDFDMKTIPLHYCTMTRYDDTFRNINIIFDKENVTMTMGEVLANKNKKQLRIAETEKYAHVTFFFSGGKEEKFKGEERVLIPSPKVATYDLQPEMSAYLVKDALIKEIEKNKFDFICLNFANGDMVGHTGIYSAIEKAVKTVDDCVGQVVEAAVQNQYTVLIIADHGNADFAVNEDGSPNTAHSLNPVPCLLISEQYKSINNGILADVAPTLLKIMEIEKPPVMTGKSLI